MAADWRPLDQLVPADMERTPAWKYTFRGKSVGPNQGVVRPLRPKEVPDETIVRTRFRLGDGTTEVGYCFPKGTEARDRPGPPGDYDRAIPWMTPAIVTDSGIVPFWLLADAHPTAEDIAPYYARLGRATAIFPIEFSADVTLDAGEIASGVVSGFHFIVYDGSGFEVVTIA